MRIAFVIPNLGGGGAEKVLQLIAQQACHQGFRLVVYTLDASPPSYTLPPEVTVIPLSQAQVSKDLYIPVYAVRLWRELRRFQPQRILAWLPRANFVALLLKPWLKVPCWISEHIDTMAHLEKLGLRGRLAQRIVKRLYPWADGIVAVSHGVRDTLVQLGIQPHKVKVIHNPVELDRWQSPPESGPLRIVTMGRLAPQKNQALLLEAAAPLLIQYQARLQILGDGPLLSALQAQAQRLGIAAQVDFLGWHPRPEEVVQGASLFAFSSDFEGFGNAIVEAMACGLPVVSTDCPSGPAEILGGSQYGLLVPVGDVLALRQALERLLSQPELRAQLRAKSLQRAREFAVEVIWKQYRQALSLDEA